MKNEYDRLERERIKRIRESDITKEIHFFNAAFRDAIAERRNRGMSENERAGYEQLRRFSPETYEEVLDFEKKFPDVNGSIIWAMKLKIWRANGVNI